MLGYLVLLYKRGGREEIRGEERRERFSSQDPETVLLLRPKHKTQRTEFFRQCVFASSVGVGQRQPGHLTVIFLEGCVISIGGRKDNLKTWMLCFNVFVILRQLWGKPTAWTTPMGGEVDADSFASKSLLHRDGACFGDNCVAKQG